jgi:hypothetical protein
MPRLHSGDKGSDIYEFSASQRRDFMWRSPFPAKPGAVTPVAAHQRSRQLFRRWQKILPTVELTQYKGADFEYHRGLIPELLDY